MATQIADMTVGLHFDSKKLKTSMNTVEKEIDTGAKKSGSSFGGTWAVAAGSLIAKGISKAASFVSSHMDAAISRMDTLNNFPKVMEALGYSAEEAAKSTDNIATHLDGLPTSLDGMINGVQLLSATMGNLADGEVNATSVGLALNDMFLAAGRSSEESSAALEMYNKMLAQGKVDMQSWQSVVRAAPGQIDQLAKSLLGAEANNAALYEELKKGKLSMDDLNAAIVKLDKEGGDGFASFSSQAIVGTQGLGTQLDNINNSINKVIEAAMSGKDISGMVEQLTNRITAVIPTLMQGVVGGTTAIVNAIPQILPQITQAIIDATPMIIDGFMQLIDSIIAMLPTMLDSIINATIALIDKLVEILPDILQKLIDVMWVLFEKIVAILPDLIPKIVDGLMKLVEVLTRPENIQKIIMAGVMLLSALVKAIPKVIVSLIQALPQIITNLIKFFSDPSTVMMLVAAGVDLFMGLVAAVPEILAALFGAFVDLFSNLWDMVKGVFSNFAGNFGETISGVFKGAVNGVLQFLENFINQPIRGINKFIEVINDKLGGLGVHIDVLGELKLPRLAEGGIAVGATTAVIGEAGKEAVLPLERNTDNWAGLLAHTLAAEMEIDGVGGKEIIVNMTNNINNEMDADEIGRRMMQSIRRAV